MPILNFFKCIFIVNQFWQIFFIMNLIRVNNALIIEHYNLSYPLLPGLEPMSSSKFPHFSTIEKVSRTNGSYHRHRRQVIAGQIYEWHSYEIPFQIWGGDGKYFL